MPVLPSAARGERLLTRASGWLLALGLVVGFLAIPLLETSNGWLIPLSLALLFIASVTVGLGVVGMIPLETSSRRNP